VILIVDDNAGIRQTIKAMLQEMETEFCECNDGSQALEMYRTCRPDWVLMDVRMGIMDGLTATRQITSAFPKARVIIVTNYTSSMLRAEATAAGAVGYVFKDDLTELLNIIHQTPEDQP
jgi:CheY-like chemotaxis protein